MYMFLTGKRLFNEDYLLNENEDYHFGTDHIEHFKELYKYFRYVFTLSSD